MTSAGSKTIFRRQNAMGENWQEEARNGTMSLLSQITKAGPSLEEELVRLNQEAFVLKGECTWLDLALIFFLNISICPTSESLEV